MSTTIFLSFHAYRADSRTERRFVTGLGPGPSSVVSRLQTGAPSLARGFLNPPSHAHLDADHMNKRSFSVLPVLASLGVVSYHCLTNGGSGNGQKRSFLGCARNCWAPVARRDSLELFMQNGPTGQKMLEAWQFWWSSPDSSLLFCRNNMRISVTELVVNSGTLPGCGGGLRVSWSEAWRTWADRCPEATGETGLWNAGTL